MKDHQKKKSFKVGTAMAIGGVVVGSLGCFVTGTSNPAPIEPEVTVNPAPDMSDMWDMPIDSEPDVTVNPVFVDMPPDADMTDMTDMTVDMEPDFTVNPAPIDMSVDADMFSDMNDMENDG